MGVVQSGIRSQARRTIRLRPVEDSENALPLAQPQYDGPLFVGDGALDYVCPKCFTLRCEGIAPGDLAGIAIRCAYGAVGCVPA